MIKEGGFTPVVCLKCGYRRKRQEEDHCFFYDAPCRRVYGYCRRGYGGRDKGMEVGPVKGIGPVGRRMDR